MVQSRPREADSHSASQENYLLSRDPKVLKGYPLNLILSRFSPF